MKITKLPAPPMKLEKAACAYWDSIGKALIKAHKLEDTDLYALALLAASLVDVDSARAAVAIDGYVIESARGSAKGHPAARQLTLAKAAAIQLLQQFGMTPVSRDRAKAAQGAGKRDPLADFI